VPLLALLLTALLCASIRAQEPAGYTPDNRLSGTPLVGVWTSKSLHQHDGQAVDLWHRVEIRADGEMVHDYYSVNPSSGNPNPIERLFSQWSAGQYVDPDPAQGTYQVIRISPYESHSLMGNSDEYLRMRGEFIPVYRRFSFSQADGQLTLSEPFVLVVPYTNAPRSFPAEATYLDYTRYVPISVPTSIAPTRWGLIKSQQMVEP
tara:strand:- start:157 stop:771 length:615 start_codon:yes stop_codon:yes gene_type:complete